MSKDFSHIVSEHSAILFKIGRAYCRTNADFNDLQQEMMIQLWKSYKSFKGDSKFSSWMYRVCLNTAISYAQKEKKRSQTFFNYKPFHASAEDASEAEEKERIHEALYGCISQLKKDEKAVILLYLEEKKYAEIAAILGLSTSLVGVKINRIKSKLEVCIKPKLL